MSVKTFSALAAAELMAVRALDTKDASIFNGGEKILPPYHEIDAIIAERGIDG